MRRTCVALLALALVGWGASMSRPKPLKWRWVDAIISPDGPRSSVRHLCLTLAAKHMEPDGGRCFPGTRKIAEEMDVRRQTVLELVHEAEAQGWLRVEKRRGGRRGGEFNQYFPAIPIEESGAPAAPVTDAEAVRLPHRSESESGAVDDESGAVDGSKAVRLAHLSCSVVNHGIHHGNVPSVLTNGDGIPQGWEPPSDWQDHRVFFDLMDEDARRMAHYLLDGDVRIAIASPTDLGLLTEAQIRRLQYHLAVTRGLDQEAS